MDVRKYLRQSADKHTIFIEAEVIMLMDDIIGVSAYHISKHIEAVRGVNMGLAGAYKLQFTVRL